MVKFILKKIAYELNKLDNLIVMEFGVYKGESLKILSANISNVSAKILFALNELKYYLSKYYFSFDEFPSDEVKAVHSFELSNKCKSNFLFKQRKNMSIPVARVFGKISN